MLSQTVERYLRECDVEFRIVTHSPSQSTEATAQAAHVPTDHVAKGILLRDDAGPVLAVIRGDQWLRVHAVQELLNRPLELASEPELAAVFPDCVLGAVPPLGPAYGIETVVDLQLFDLARVFIEAGDHEHLIAVSADAFAGLLAGARRGHIAEVR
jgi:Ala-tRNA(Pro) deacylase